MIAVQDARGFDFHCHVDLQKDPVRFIQRCERERIVTVAVTTTPKAWPQNKAWMSGSSYVIPALGLHPELVASRLNELESLLSQLGDAPIIGEVGLEGGKNFKSSLATQRTAFIQILSAAQLLGHRILTLHSRGAAHDVISAVRDYTTVDKVTCILHWFSGSLVEAARAVEAGLFFSINGQMLMSEAGRQLAMFLPADRLLTETDSPFSRAQNGTNQPWDVGTTVAAIASLKSISCADMTTALSENSKRVLQFALR